MSTKKLKPGMRAWSWASENGTYYIFSCTLIQLKKDWRCSWKSWEYKTDNNQIASQMENLMYPSFAAAKQALVEYLKDLYLMKRASLRSIINRMNDTVKELDDYEDALESAERLEEPK